MKIRATRSISQFTDTMLFMALQRKTKRRQIFGGTAPSQSNYFQMSGQESYVHALRNEMAPNHTETIFWVEHGLGHHYSFPEEPPEKRRDTCECLVKMVRCMARFKLSASISAHTLTIKRCCAAHGRIPCGLSTGHMYGLCELNTPS